MATYPVINPLAISAVENQDPQVFEYTKTLSLPIDPAKNNGATIGSVVSVGDIFGVMLTEVGLTAEQKAALGKNPNWLPAMATTQGFNAPGYASVRVHGGAYKIKGIAHSGAVAAGKAVYAKQDGDHVTVTTAASGATRIGFLYQGIPAGNSTDDAIVVLD